MARCDVYRVAKVTLVGSSYRYCTSLAEACEHINPYSVPLENQLGLSSNELRDYQQKDRYHQYRQRV